MERIYLKHVHEILGSHEDVPIINVLPKERFQEERIPESINIPFKNPDQFLQAVEDIVPSKNHKVVVHCSSEACSTSHRAAKALDDAGFTEVMNFVGGLEEWKAGGGKVIREKDWQEPNRD